MNRADRRAQERKEKKTHTRKKPAIRMANFSEAASNANLDFAFPHITAENCASTPTEFVMSIESLERYAVWKADWEKRQAAMTPEERLEEARKRWDG